MKNISFIKWGMAIFFAGAFASCNKDLNRVPTNDVTSTVALSTYAGFQSAAIKMYAANALSGNSGNGSTDLQGFDAGSSDFIRSYWNAQVLTTDEAINAWGDANVGTTELHTFNWTSSTGGLNNLYNRCYYVIAVCNEFIRQATASNLSSHSISGTQAQDITYYAAEARFIRAYQYWVLMDLFGNIPYIVETDPVGSYVPPQKNSAFIFSYVESELKAIDGLLKPVKTADYARVDQGADWALLARLYLNAQVYTGTARWTDAITYSSKVINGGYSLMTKYANLFLADNNLNNPEQIWSLAYDGTNSQVYGGTTFLINGAINGAMNPASFGVSSGGWSGNRSTSNLPALFADITGKTDTRAMFTWQGASTKAANDTILVFTNGLPVVKFKNITSTGVGGLVTSADGTSASTDFPVLRLAEQYLIYAEAVLRGGTGGSNAQALAYFNALRTRAYGNTTGNVTSIALQDILDERAREMYWECTRRTDLIRYGVFTSASYVWPWKGNVKNGQGVDSHYNLFPLPAATIVSDPSLKQNPGY